MARTVSNMIMIPIDTVDGPHFTPPLAEETDSQCLPASARLHSWPRPRPPAPRCPAPCAFVEADSALSPTCLVSSALLLLVLFLLLSPEPQLDRYRFSLHKRYMARCDMALGLTNVLMFCLRVEFLLKTVSGYPKDTGDTLITLGTSGNPLRYNTYRSVPSVSNLAHSRGPRKRSQSPVDVLEH